MKWPWRRKEKLCESRIRTNSKLMELETAKEILAEIFQTRPADVDEMIQSRLGRRGACQKRRISGRRSAGKNYGLRLFV